MRQHVIEPGELEIIEILVEYLCKYLQTRQMALLVRHIRRLQISNPPQEMIERFEEGLPANYLPLELYLYRATRGRVVRPAHRIAKSNIISFSTDPAGIRSIIVRLSKSMIAYQFGDSRYARQGALTGWL